MREIIDLNEIDLEQAMNLDLANEWRRFHKELENRAICKRVCDSLRKSRLTISNYSNTKFNKQY